MNISRRALRVFDPECIVPKVCSIFVVAERSERTLRFYPPLSQKVTERRKTSLDMGGEGQVIFRVVSGGMGAGMKFGKDGLST